jgi:signal transduction histidine kinase
MTSRLSSGEQHVDSVSEFIEEERDALRADNLAIRVVDRDGRTVLTSQKRVPAWPRMKDDGWRVTTVQLGLGTAVIGVPWEDTENALRTQTLVLAAVGLCVVLAAAGGAWMLVGRTLSPIGLLSREAQAASGDSLPVRLNAPSRDAEIVELVATLNHLLARVSKTTAAKGRFHAAASHELRTPLQALSGHLEVALSQECTADEYRATVAEALAQTQRLSSLVRDLLLLHELDVAVNAHPKEPVSVAEICERALAQLQPLLAQRSLHLHAELTAEGIALAPPMHVEVLARNLIDNAVRHARPAGEVRVAVSEHADGTTLTVANTCEAIPDWDAEALFEPFSRRDAARSAKTGGHGLGVAICSAVTAANGWKLTLEYDGGQVLATVRFPASREQTG